MIQSQMNFPLMIVPPDDKSSDVVPAKPFDLPPTDYGWSEPIINKEDGSTMFVVAGRAI